MAVVAGVGEEMKTGSFGEAMRQYRWGLGFGIEEFCEKCGFDFAVWGGIEQGLVVPNHSDYKAIENKVNQEFGDDLFYLFAFETWKHSRPHIEQVPEDAVINAHGVPVQDVSLPMFINAAVVDVINRYHEHGLFV